MSTMYLGTRNSFLSVNFVSPRSLKSPRSTSPRLSPPSPRLWRWVYKCHRVGCKMMKWRIYSSLYWSGVSTCDPGTSCQHFLDTTLNISFSKRLSLLGAWREGVEESFIRDELNYNISTHIRHWAKHRWEEQSLWIDPLEDRAVFDCLNLPGDIGPNQSFV